MFGLVNVWGSFWWFKPARAVTRLFGLGDYHARAPWGQRLFSGLRAGKERAEGSSAFFRSTESWAYDWFANPRWNAHRPAEILRWLNELGLDHVGSVPSIVEKRPGATWFQALCRRVLGAGTFGMAFYWLISGESNMFYVTARKRS